MKSLTSLIPIILIVLVFWLLILRPARNRSRATARMQSTLELGARVMTTSGIHGTIRSMGNETVRLEVAPGVMITMHRNAIGNVIRDSDSSASDMDPGDDNTGVNLDKNDQDDQGRQGDSRT
ncbi:MAG: preprotein translocase subunit YajC [Nocardioidaceae bacterium]